MTLSSRGVQKNCSRTRVWTFNGTSAPCKHRLGLRLYQRAADALLAGQERWEPAVTQDEHAPVPPEHLLLIQGTPFVRFAGLLQLAHARGLVALETTVVSVSLDQADFWALLGGSLG